DLALSGQTWTSSLSTSQVSLAAAASGHFTVTVTIPADALAHATDTVTVSATSQGEPALKANVVLTTSYPGAQQKIYLPLITR
ncbi:MAG: hypothetical protein PVG33_11310, partial [Chloroflexota bacterium]